MPEVIVVTGASAGLGRAIVERTAGTVECELGPVDVWANNSMVSVYSPTEEMTAAECRRMTEVTCLGCVHGSGAFFS